MDNTVTIIGNLAREPEIRFTPSGQAICTFGVACNRRWQNRQTQEWEEQVSFFDVTAWAQLGQNAADTLMKGSRVMVTGRLEQQSWDTKEGDKRTKVVIVADDIGPSLRWATAEIARNERTDDTRTARPSPKPKTYDPAEEPF